MAELTLERLANELRTQRYGRSLQHVLTTDSTNEDARKAIDAGAPNGHVIVADAQLRGRGSRGRSWSSPGGTDLYLSIVDRLPIALAQLPPLTLAVGLGVADSVDGLLPANLAPRAEVKWPNDVWIAGRKCAGILVEAMTGEPGADSLIIGIGLNVNRQAFPEDLSQATSLWLAAGTVDPLDRVSALCCLLANVERWVDRFVADGAGAVVEALTPRLALRGQAARCDAMDGIVRGVTSSGALQFETDAGLREIIAGRLEVPSPNTG
jgi:BirA family biotin operon repressor/biotin-[acetyl-CoA-carboxylase] ligase